MKIKIVTIIVTVTVVAFLILGSYLYIWFSDVLIDHTIQSDSFKLNTAVSSIASAFEEAETLIRNLAHQDAIQHHLHTAKNQTPSAQISSQLAINKLLSQVSTSSHFVHSLALISESGMITWTEMPYYDTISTKDKQAWYQLCRENLLPVENSSSLLASSSYVFTDCSGKSIRLMSVALPCMSMEIAGKRLGWIVVNLDTERLQSILEAYLDDGFDAIIMVLQDSFALGAYCSEEAEQSWLSISAPLYQTLSTPISQELVLQQESKRLITAHPVTRGYTLIAMRNYKAIASVIRPPLMRILLLLLIATATLISLLTLCMLHIAKPTRQLVDAMEAVSQGNLNATVSIHTGDEFEQIGAGFNQMIGRLSVFLQQSLEQEARRHKLEYELLISQIKPHFIYNTLNTVIYLAEKHGNQDIVTLVHALIHLLRDSIHQKNQPLHSTIERETALIANYITIQNYRYKDLFHLHISTEGCSGFELIPRAILQPLVENALFHGISSLGKVGDIWLTISPLPAGGLCICVRDNGVGIDSGLLQALKADSFHKDPSGKPHIGLHNIRQRLNLLYPDANTFTIDSMPGEGTCITICLWPQNESNPILQV